MFPYPFLLCVLVNPLIPPNSLRSGGIVPISVPKIRVGCIFRYDIEPAYHFFLLFKIRNPNISSAVLQEVLLELHPDP